MILFFEYFAATTSVERTGTAAMTPPAVIRPTEDKAIFRFLIIYFPLLYISMTSKLKPLIFKIQQLSI